MSQPQRSGISFSQQPSDQFLLAFVMETIRKRSGNRVDLILRDDVLASIKHHVILVTNPGSPD
jgi:hypothetical protein